MHKLTKEEFISRAKEIHKDKYDYSKVNYINNSTKVTIVCKTCGKSFEQAPGAHLRGQGCPNCANESRSRDKRMSLEKVISKAKEVHKDKYDYSKITNYKNCNEKVEIVCPIHGSFFQDIKHHVFRGHGCPECNGGVLQTREEFIAKAVAIHGNKYDYSKVVYVNAITPVEIICKTHNKSFWQTPHTHITGKGDCPDCAGIGSSKL